MEAGIAWQAPEQAHGESPRTTCIPPGLAVLLSRHSLGPRWMSAPGPDARELRLALAAALRAPDHGRLVPWRAVLVTQEQRGALGELFARFAQELGKSIEDIETERDRARNGPALVAWVVRIDESLPEVPPHEQWLCAGGALANFLNALHAMGFAAKMLSGRKCSHPAVRDAFCETGEALAGFVCVGTPTRRPAPRGADDPDVLLSTWRPW